MRILRMMGIAAVGLSASGVVFAQTTPLAPPPAVQAPATTGPVSPMITDQQIVDEVNARLATLKANLRLTAEQQTHWPSVEAAVREASVMRIKQRLVRQSAMRAERDAYREQMRKWREDMRNRQDGMRTDPPPQPGRASALERMKSQAEMMAARATEMHRIADSAGPLYAALDDSQRGRLMEGIRRIGEEGMRGMGRRERGGWGGEGDRGGYGRRGWQD